MSKDFLLEQIKAFADCIQMILDEYGIDIPNRRRKFDLFLWYANRKKQVL